MHNIDSIITSCSLERDIPPGSNDSRVRGGAFAQACSKARSREMFMILNYLDIMSLFRLQLDMV